MENARADRGVIRVTPGDCTHGEPHSLSRNVALRLRDLPSSGGKTNVFAGKRIAGNSISFEWAPSALTGLGTWTLDIGIGRCVLGVGRWDVGLGAWKHYDFAVIGYVLKATGVVSDSPFTWFVSAAEVVVQRLI